MTPKPVTINEMKFSSIREACKFFKINYSTVSKRLKKGCSLNEALTRSIYTLKSHCKYGHQFSEENTILTTKNNHTYRTCKVCLDERKKNRNKEQKTSRPHNLAKPITILGTTFPSIISACKHFQIRYKTVQQRLNRGLSYAAAFTQNTQPKRKTHCKRGHKYEGYNIITRIQNGYITHACRECKRASDRIRGKNRKQEPSK